MRQLEGVVPERVFAGRELLHLAPVVDDVPVLDDIGKVLVGDLAAGQRRMALRRVADRHLVAAVGVREIVVDPLFFHQPAGEVEVGFAVLHAVIARLKRARQVEVQVETVEHHLEDVGHRLVLEDPALGTLRPQPETRHDFHAIADKLAVALALGDAAADSIEVALLATRHLQTRRHRLPEQLVEGHVLVGLGKEVELIAEQTREPLMPVQADQEEHVLVQRRANGKRAILLSCGGYHFQGSLWCGAIRPRSRHWSADRRWRIADR